MWFPLKWGLTPSVCDHCNQRRWGCSPIPALWALRIHSKFLWTKFYAPLSWPFHAIDAAVSRRRRRRRKEPFPTRFFHNVDEDDDVKQEVE